MDLTSWAAPLSHQWAAGGGCPWQEAAKAHLESQLCPLLHGPDRFQQDATQERTEHTRRAPAACGLPRARPLGRVTCLCSPGRAASPRISLSTGQATTGQLSYARKDGEGFSPKAQPFHQQATGVPSREELASRQGSLCPEAPGLGRSPCPPFLPAPWKLVSCRSRHICSRESSFRRLQRRAEGQRGRHRGERQAQPGLQASLQPVPKTSVVESGLAGTALLSDKQAQRG